MRVGVTVILIHLLGSRETGQSTRDDFQKLKGISFVQSLFGVEWVTHRPT